MKLKTKTINLCGVQTSTEMGSNLFACLFVVFFLSRFVSDTITTRFDFCYSLLLYNVNLLRLEIFIVLLFIADVHVCNLFSLT